MQLFIKKTVGNQQYNFVVEGENLEQLLLEQNKLSFEDVHHCGICNSKNLFLNGRVAKTLKDSTKPTKGFDEYTYSEIKCRDCKSSVVFGKTKENINVFFLRKREENGSRVLDWQEFKQDGGQYNR
jgi:hypothetical protein